jgi:hypothetical protein
MSTNTLDEATKRAIDELKSSYSYLLFNTDGSNVTIEKRGKINETFEDLKSILPQDDPRFCLFNMHDKIISILWMPSGSYVRRRMIFSSSYYAIRQQIEGIVWDVSATNLNELDEQVILDKVFGKGHMKP